ncbi:MULTISPECIES: aldehyde dehydrogenase family protein [unclassified Nocardia]|uniref:aldehyde dehydrogenase family protein n=1 Tax=unclassified Nocardia TaxID=2637762 RepID=UPI001CE3FE45|nr:MULTISPECIES: aldehyde dehydrogenase family protein [unclassified Nocardia]
MYEYESLNKQFIVGEWVSGTGTTVLVDTNPYDDTVLTKVQGAATADVDRAYASAAAAQTAWAATNPFERRLVLENVVREVETHRADIARLITEETGGTVIKTAVEIDLALQMLREAVTLPVRMEGRIMPSPLPDRENLVYREPVGVVSVIGPFNFPFLLALKSVAPALAVGNAVVVKPHEQTPILGGTILAEIFRRAGLPDGVLNVIVADIAELGDSFITHPIPRVISFTGSTTVGAHIGEVAARHFKRSVLELGGNSALIVLEDADLELAVDAAVFSRFTHQGQICLSANRLVVAREVYDRFVEGYLRKVESLPVGDPRDPATIVGPLISDRQADTVESLIEQAIAGNATALVRGVRSGRVLAPTVLGGVTTDMPISREELFGPVALIMAAEDEDDAIRIANETPFGLSGAVHSRDIDRAIRVARRIDSGMVHVNDGTIHDEPNVPFGGEKSSGVGRLNGESSLAEFTTLKWISVNRGRRQFPY